MAFNPFNVFRRNQRILFSILTIVVMFMFVLSFGQGDFFDKIPRYLEKHRHSGEVMAVVDDDKVYASDFGKVEEKRVLANRYMYLAGAKASENLAKYVSDGTARVSAENRETIRQAMEQHKQLGMFAQFLQSNPRKMEILDQILGPTRDSLANIVNAKNPKENDLDIAKVMQTLLELDLHLIGGKQGHYFSNQPGETNRDTMNFILWSTKAKSLGIELREDDIKTLVKDEFSGKVSDEELKTISDEFKSKKGFTAEVLSEALAEEFKVRAAQDAVMGRSMVRSNGRGYESPYDYYQYYKDQCSTTKYGMISISADNYLDKVTATPTESEIEAIYRKHSNDLPDPSLARPGLKVPRKLKLEWIEVTGNEPYYKAAAEKALQQGEAFSLQAPALLLAMHLMGISSASLPAIPTTYAGQDMFLRFKYEEYKREHRSAVQSSWYSPSSIFLPQKPLDSSVSQPTGVVALAGVLGGGYASGGSPFAAPATLVGTSYAADRKARLLALQPALMFPAGPMPGAMGYWMTVAVSLAAATEPLPIQTLKPVLLERAKEETARFLASEDLVKLQLELAKLVDTQAKVPFAKQRARETIDAFVKSRGVKRGEASEYRDVFTLASDPGFAPLKERHDLSEQLSSSFTDPRQFGKNFFEKQDPNTRQVSEASTLFELQPYPAQSFAGAPLKGESIFAVWRSAEIPATAVAASYKTPEDKAKVRNAVIPAWRRQKARELAKQAAEELAKQCNGLGKTFAEIEPKLRDKAAQFGSQFPAEAGMKVRYFEVDDVAPLVAQTLPSAQRNAPTVPYSLPPSLYIPHPSTKMKDELLANREKPPSTSFVLVDNSEDTYYVATVLARNERDAELFGFMVYGPFAKNLGDLEPTISRKHQEGIRKQTYDTAIELLKAEFKYKDEHADVSKKKESSDD